MIWATKGQSEVEICPYSAVSRKSKLISGVDRKFACVDAVTTLFPWTRTDLGTLKTIREAAAAVVLGAVVA